MLLEANDSILRERVGSGAQCYKFKRGFVLAHLVTRFYRCPFGPRILRAPLARAARIDERTRDYTRCPLK